MANNTPPSNTQKPLGKGGAKSQSPIGGGSLVGTDIRIGFSTDIKETAKEIKDSFKGIEDQLKTFTNGFDSRLNVLNSNLKKISETSNKWSNSIEKMGQMITALGEKTHSKIAETSKKTSESIKTAATEASAAVKESTAATEEGSKKTKKALKEVDDQAKETTKTFSTFSEKLKAMAGPAVAQGLTASFGIFFNVIGRLKEYDTYLGQLHTKITNTNGDLKKYQDTLLTQSIVPETALSFGLTPEQRKEAMGSFATYASESEKYSKNTAGSIKNLTEGAAGLFKGIGIPIAESAATLMDFHKKLGLTYAEMEKFALSTTAVYRQSNMTTDQFKKLLDVLPNIARAYGLSSKASQEFVVNSMEVGKAIAAMGMNVDETVAKMNRMSEGSEDALIQSMILGLNPADASGNMAKFAAKAREIYSQTGGDNASNEQLYLRRQTADVFGLKEFSNQDIAAMAKGTYQEKDGKLEQQKIEQSFKEASKSLENAAIKYERPFVTLDQQISQFFTEMETRIVRKFSEAVVDFKNVMSKVGEWIKKAVDFIDKITGGSGLGLGGLGMASLVAGFIVGPLVAGVVRAISNALGVGRLGQLLLSLVGLGRFNPLLGQAAGAATTAVGTAAAAAPQASQALLMARQLGTTVASGGFSGMIQGVLTALTSTATLSLGTLVLAVLAGGAGVAIGTWINSKIEAKRKEKEDLAIHDDQRNNAVQDRLINDIHDIKTKEQKQEIEQRLIHLNKTGQYSDQTFHSFKGRLEAADKLKSDESEANLTKLKTQYEAEQKKLKDTYSKEIKDYLATKDDYEKHIKGTILDKGAPSMPYSVRQEHFLRGALSEVNERLSNFTEKQEIGSKAEVRELIKQVAQQNKFDPKLADVIAGIETGGQYDSGRTNKDSGAMGLWQFVPGTRREYGLSDADAKDPVKSTEKALQKLTNIKRFYGISDGEMTPEQAQLVGVTYHSGEGTVTRGANTRGGRWFAPDGRDISKEAEEYGEKIAKEYNSPRLSRDELTALGRQLNAQAKAKHKFSPGTTDATEATYTATSASPDKKQGELGTALKSADTGRPLTVIATLPNNTVSTTRSGGQTGTENIVAPKSSVGGAITIPDTSSVVAQEKPTDSVSQNTIVKPEVKREDAETLQEVHDKQTYNVLKEIATLLKQPRQQPMGAQAQQPSYSNPFWGDLSKGQYITGGGPLRLS